MTWAALAQQAVPIKQTTKSTGSSSAVAKPVSGSSSGATPTVKSWLPPLVQSTILLHHLVNMDLMVVVVVVNLEKKIGIQYILEVYVCWMKRIKRSFE